ncbi:MAG: hypothetical protein JW910_20720, partial [Anaerolineae bacterium]|nr:hypothetical protein [Anaerolineae bacterium]
MSDWPRLRGWARRINLILLALLFAFLIAFAAMSFMTAPPYDYALLMHGAETFCFAPDDFEFGLSLHAYYPAPFYTLFCLPAHFALTEAILRVLWLFVPVGLTLWLARGRAAALAYPPLGVLLLIGQSSWLLLPLYILAARDDGKKPSRWWFGLIVALGVIKPHVALPAWLWLSWRWWRRREWPALITWGLALIVLVVPSFLMRPGWLLEWLPNGRGFESVNLASIALIPVQVGGLDFAPPPGALLAVWGFCALVGTGVYALLRWRRGRLTGYDWVLLFFFISPVLNDYDLVVLLPFITRRRRRLLLALTAGVVTWLFAMVTRIVPGELARWS